MAFASCRLTHYMALQPFLPRRLEDSKGSKDLEEEKKDVTTTARRTTTSIQNKIARCFLTMLHRNIVKKIPF
jgi:hypothetical protein